MPKRTPKIVEQLRRAIRRAAISRYEIAKLSGVSEGMLSVFVNGKGDVRLATASKIAEALGLTLELTSCR